MRTDQAIPVLLYKVWNGILEIVTLLDEHNMCDGATEETYLVRGKGGRKSSCSKDDYFTTEKAAWTEYATQLREAIEREEKLLVKMEARLLAWRAELIGIKLWKPLDRKERS